MRTHNITTLTSEIYDTLFRNTKSEQFDCDDVDLQNFYVDETAGCIYLEYQDKAFEVVIREK